MSIIDTGPSHSANVDLALFILGLILSTIGLILIKDKKF
jgi:hypothetical protein